MHAETPEMQKAFYKSKTWQRCRDEYMKSVGGLCERCEARGIIRPARIVHHKEYISPANIRDPFILLSFDNLEALCQDCHNNEHFKKNKRYKANIDGTIEVF